MGWISRSLVASAVCVACGVHRPAAVLEVDELSLDFGDLEDDLECEGSEVESEDDCPERLAARGPMSTVFVALPNVRIYALDYPGVPGQAAWFAEPVGSGRVRYAFYIAEDEGREARSGAAALRDFRRICGAQACRRGDIDEVKAAWAAQLELWQQDESELLAGALVDGAAPEGALLRASAD